MTLCSKCTAKMGDHVRLLSFSSPSSPQAPVLTAPNGRCMLPRAVFLHSEACFFTTKTPSRGVPPRNGPHGLTRNRYGTHLTLSGSGRAWNFLWHSRSPATHHLRYVVRRSLTPGQATPDYDTLGATQSSNKRWLIA